MLGICHMMNSWPIIKHRKRDQKPRDNWRSSKTTPKNFTNAHNDIPWREISGTIDRLIHDYTGVNYDIVWVVIANDLPSLRPRLLEILQSDET